MRRFTILASLGLVLFNWAWAQETRMIRSAPEALYAPDRNFLEMPRPASTPDRVTVPVGTRVAGDIDATKIGESFNAFSHAATSQQPVHYLPSQGFLVSVYNQNVSICGGDGFERPFRYSYSTDNGMSWKDGTIGPGTCFGFGSLVNDATQLWRSPSIAAFLPSGGTDTTDIKLAFFSRSSNDGQFFTGNAVGIVNDPTNWVSPAANVLQEDYPLDNFPDFGLHPYVERVPGEYWTLSPLSGNDPNTAGNLSLWRGVYSNTTQQATWTLAATLDPDHLVDTAAIIASPHLAFSPDGSYGIAVWLGDLVSNTGIPGSDSVFSIVYSESNDGGATWGAPEEINLPGFENLQDSVRSFWTREIVVNGDTSVSTFATGLPTTGFDLDVTVDANGSPHIFTLIGAAQIFQEDGTPTELNSYSIYSGARKFMYDFTRDQTGEWNGIYVGSPATFRGDIGVAPDDLTTIDPYMSISRSADGTKIFYSYTDTDTTGNFSSADNNFPNLIGRALDLTTGLMTADSAWTQGDANFDGVAYFPNASPVVIDNGDGSFGVPVVFNGFTNPFNTTDLWYTTLRYEESDMVQPAQYLNICGATNVEASVIVEQRPTCDNADGVLSLTGQSGLAPYTYLWNGPGVSGVASDSVGDLVAGIYTVTITDANGCTSEETFVLESDGSADISFAAVDNISCFDSTDGSAAVVPTGGTAPFSFAWDNGETDSIAVSLDQGSNRVTVTDANGCISFGEVAITRPAELEIPTVLEDRPTCAGDSDGEIFVEATGGTGTLTYSWDNGATGQNLTGLTPGTYEVTVTDDNGCVTTTEAEIAPTPELAISTESFENSSADNPNGAVSIIIDSPGNGIPYDYFARLIFAGGSTRDTVINDLLGATSPTGDPIGGLCAGEYEISIIDPNGCTALDTVVVEGVDCSFITHISQAGLANLSIFPNPTSGMVEVELDMDQARSLKLEIFNAQGQLIEQQSEDRVSSYRTRFNLVDQAAGIYLLRVSTPQGVETHRIVRSN